MMRFLSHPQLWQEMILRLGSFTRVTGKSQIGQGVGWFGVGGGQVDEACVWEVCGVGVMALGLEVEGGGETGAAVDEEFRWG